MSEVAPASRSVNDLGVARCPLCGSQEAAIIHSVARAALQVALPQEAAPSDDDYAALRIVRCVPCGHIYNAAFDPSLSGKMYGGTFLTNTPVHVSMMDHLREIVEWIGDESYAGKSVIEIGAGSGHVARIVAEKAADVTIFEPCTELRPEMLPEGNIRLRNEMFSASATGDPVDLIICRQVIEHVPDPRSMLADIRGALKPGGLAYLEVPRTEYTYENLTVGDFHQAHVQYFMEDGFQRIGRDTGLNPIRLRRLKEAHDFGVLFRRESIAAPAQAPSKVGGYEDFPARISGVVGKGREVMSALSPRLALFGANWQTQGLLATLPAEPRFSVAFDDNADYHGAWVHGGGYQIPIVPPDPRVLDGIDTVVIGPFLHDRVIAAKLRSMGFTGDILTPRYRSPLENQHGLRSMFGPDYHGELQIK